MTITQIDDTVTQSDDTITQSDDTITMSDDTITQSPSLTADIYAAPPICLLVLLGVALFTVTSHSNLY
jgi:hypothetical protein